MDKKVNVITNMMWRLAERCGAQLVSFVVSVILARLIEPSAYGQIALITVFTSILEVFINSGLGNSLIQKKDADDLDFSTVFYTNVTFCLLMYVILYIAAPFIADFYAMPDLTALVRVIGLTLIISGVKNVQCAYVSRNMQFKLFFYSTLGGTIGAAVLGIAMAYMGFGVWALVAQSLFNNTIDTVILWINVKWRPKKEFSFSRLKRLYSYGWKLLVTSLINTVYNDIRQLIIGKMYGPSDLAYYNKGNQLPNLAISNINSSIDSVLFPTMSSAQDDKARVKEMTRTSIRTSSYVIWPIMLGLSAVATPMIRLLITDKWLPCVPYMRIFCFALGFQPIHSANLNAIKAMGRSDITLKLEIIKKTMGILILVVVMPYGPFAICASTIVYSFMAQVLNTYPNRELLGYSYGEQLKDILPFAAMSAVMCGAVLLIGLLPCGDVLKLALQIPAGILFYIAQSIVFKVDVFYMLLDLVKKLLPKKKK